jgi:hypothetical protein
MTLPCGLDDISIPIAGPATCITRSSVCLWQIYYLWWPNLPDEEDNHVVELAVAGGGEVIVTHNIGDFAHAELRFPGLRILQPAALLQEDPT